MQFAGIPLSRCDAKFGATSPSCWIFRRNEAAVGLDTSDPASKDDVVTGTMYLPVNRQWTSGYAP